MLCPGEATSMVSFKPLSVLRSGDSHPLPTLEGTKLREVDQLHEGAQPGRSRVWRASGLPRVYTAPLGIWEGTGRSGQQCHSRPLSCPLQTHGRAVSVRRSSHRCQTKRLPRQANICVHLPFLAAPPPRPTQHCGFSMSASQTSTLKMKWHLVSGVDSGVRIQRSREAPSPSQLSGGVGEVDACPQRHFRHRSVCTEGSSDGQGEATKPACRGPSGEHSGGDDLRGCS